MASGYLFNFSESMDWGKRQIRLVLESATNIGVDPDLGQSPQTSPAGNSGSSGGAAGGAECKGCFYSRRGVGWRAVI